MYLILNKRFRFSSSHRLHVHSWSDEENTHFFGGESGGKYGHGHNFETWMGIHGPVDEKTGMIVELGALKDKINTLIDSRYDHKYLNVDTLPFHRLNPTPENIAGQLLAEVAPLLTDEPYKLIKCQLIDILESNAVSYDDKTCERTFAACFSAARVTCSPHLSEEENRAIFGLSASPEGHGHNYRIEITLAGKPDPKHGLIVSEVETWQALNELVKLWDHKNLNKEVSDFKNIPITTECMARLIFEKLSANLPLKKVRLYERSDFFAEYHRGGRFTMGIRSSFNAAHRLHSSELSDAENVELYGKCNNPEGHGHNYDVECVVTGPLDESSGAMHSLVELQTGLDKVLSHWHFKHLDLETEEFADRPSTGENIVGVLWEKLTKTLSAELWSVGLWETESNLFQMQREKPNGAL